MNLSCCDIRKNFKRDFRAPCLILSAILCFVATAFSVPGIIELFDREKIELMKALMELDYIDQSAQQSWLFVRGLVNILALIVPLLIGLGLILLLIATFVAKTSRPPVWGFGYFSAAAKIFRILSFVIAGALIVLFLFRALRYIFMNGAYNGGVLFIFAMLLPECVFLAVVAIIFVLLFRCLNSVSLTLDTIQLNVLTGRNESYGLTSGAVWLIAMMGVASCVLYVIGEEISAKICYACAAVAYFSLAVWLLCYKKRNGKRALEQFRKEILK